VNRAVNPLRCMQITRAEQCVQSFSSLTTLSRGDNVTFLTNITLFHSHEILILSTSFIKVR